MKKPLRVGIDLNSKLDIYDWKSIVKFELDTNPGWEKVLHDRLSGSTGQYLLPLDIFQRLNDSVNRAVEEVIWKSQQGDSGWTTIVNCCVSQQKLNEYKQPGWGFFIVANRDEAIQQNIIAVYLYREGII